MNPTYEEIARDCNLWGEYVDTNAEMTEDEFDAMPVNEKLSVISACFGEEEN